MRKAHPATQEPPWVKQPAAVLLILAIVACAPGPENAPDKPSPPDSLEEVTAWLDETAPSLLEKYDIPGAALAIVHGSKTVWTGAYGLPDRAGGTEVKPDTRFGVASISKPVTAWGVMRLFEQGRLDLDAPVESYLTRWHLPPSAFDREAVTVRRLLSHTSGLPTHAIRRAEPDLLDYTLGEVLSGAVPGTSGVHVSRPPGTAFVYSGDGYTLLQLVIEEVSGESFAAFMKREVLDPLGMTKSGFDWRREPPLSVATSYDRRDEPIPNYPFAHKASGGMYTTASDLATFVAAHLMGPNGERVGRGVLAPDTVQMMLSPADATAGGYGLGYQLATSPGGVPIASHGGSIRGWSSHFAALPGEGESVVVLTNRFGGVRVIERVRQMWLVWVEQRARAP